MIPLKLIALFCEYLSSQEILNIIDDYKLQPQENKYVINKEFINDDRYHTIKKKGIFEISFTKLIGNIIQWDFLSRNPAAICLLEKNKEKIDWRILSINSEAIHLLEANKEKIDWGVLSINPAALHLLETNQEEIDWRYLSENPAAIHLLEKNPEKINWQMLSKNPAAIHLLE